MNINTQTQYMKIYRLELYPNIDQAAMIDKFIIANDYFYNIAIDLEEKIHNEYISGISSKGFLFKFDIEKYISEIKNNEEWLHDVPLNACRGGAFRAVNAYLKFFKHVVNKPVYKSISNSSNSYNARADRIHLYNNYVKLDGIDTFILSQPIYFSPNIHIYNPIVGKDSCNRYWLSFSSIENKSYIPIPKSEPIGIDIGFRKDNSNTLVCSNGRIFSLPDTSILEYNIKELDKLCSNDNYRIKDMAEERNVSFYDIPMSKSMIDKRLKLNSMYAKLSNIRTNFIRQSISEIVSWNPEYISIEDISINQLQKQNRFIDFSHFPAYKFKEHIIYKCNASMIPLYLVDNTEYPSSKICSNCGSIYDINRCSDNYICKCCGLKINRDINAAINLRDYPKKLKM